MFTAFDYIYRDAGNFKAFGTMALEGELDEAGQELIRAQLSSGEFFIAEQIGVPPLYRDLHRWSGGPTSDDHCWHEFLGFHLLSEREKGTEAIDAREFVARFAAVDDWHEGLSPHFWIV